MAKQFVFDLSRWTMKEFREWSKIIQEDEPDYERMAVLGAKSIAEWPFEGSPSVPATWENISVTDWAATINALRIAVEGLFSQGK